MIRTKPCNISECQLQDLALADVTANGTEVAISMFYALSVSSLTGRVCVCQAGFARDVDAAQRWTVGRAMPQGDIPH